MALGGTPPILLLGSKGKRLFAKDHLAIFDTPPYEKSTMYQKVRDVFEKQLQIIMDFYQDICGETFAGSAQFSQVALLGVCLDELLAAFALAQRSLPGQAMQHLRVIHEALDLIKLFREKPEWANLWTSGKPWKEIWSKLSPGKVKKKIKSDPIFEKIYQSLSSLGTHPSFEMVRLRSYRRSRLSPKENPQFEIRVGPMPGIKENTTTHALLLLSTVSILAEVVSSFGQRLHLEELKTALLDFTSAFGDFALEFIAKPLQKDGNSTAQEYEQFMKTHIEKIKEEFQKMK